VRSEPLSGAARDGDGQFAKPESPLSFLFNLSSNQSELADDMTGFYISGFQYPEGIGFPDAASGPAGHLRRIDAEHPNLFTSSRTEGVTVKYLAYMTQRD